ncbi:MAG: hypothetical protein H0U88_09720, partial [Chthoniobacterales bacterium]|nr:hypothetical protein [Chthoniobacterales bacterium]
FPSLAYAKGFLLIYGKFLNVDVTPYLEAFETSETMTVDGYSYLQDNPAPKPRRTETVRTPSGGSKSSFMPLVIGIIVLFVGFYFLRLMLDLKRIKPSQRDAEALAVTTSTPDAMPSGTPSTLIAPKALPVDPTPSPSSTPLAVALAPAPVSSVPATPQPTVAAVVPTPEAEPEVRRAEPVDASDLAKAQAALASASPAPAANRFDIRPLRKTYVRVTVDSGVGGRSVERWINVSEAPLQFSGKRIAVKVLDPAAVEIRKNGKIVARGDADVRLE